MRAPRRRGGARGARALRTLQQLKMHTSLSFGACERDETCPVSTAGWTRRVHFVRERGGGGGPPRRQAVSLRAFVPRAAGAQDLVGIDLSELRLGELRAGRRAAGGAGGGRGQPRAAPPPAQRSEVAGNALCVLRIQAITCSACSEQQ